MSQHLLSTFGGGDPERLDLRLTSCVDLEMRRRVEEYAEEAACGGWELEAVTGTSVWFKGADGDAIYQIEKKDHGFCGSRCNRIVRPVNCQDLQYALDGASDYMRENPAEWVAEVDEE